MRPPVVSPLSWQCAHLLSVPHLNSAPTWCQSFILTVRPSVVRHLLLQWAHMLSVFNLTRACCWHHCILKVRPHVIITSFWQCGLLLLVLYFDSAPVSNSFYTRLLSSLIHFDRASTCCHSFILTVRPRCHNFILTVHPHVVRPSFWLAVHRSPCERGHEDESAGRCATGGESARQSEHASFRAPTNQSTRHT